MSLVVERLGSRTFDAGVGGGTGRLLFTVLQADDEDDAVELALAQSIVQPSINGYLLESWSVEDLGGQNYNVDVQYKRGVPGEAAATAGQTPSEARPAPTGGNNDDEVGRDMSFSVGGGTKHISQVPPGGMTRHKVAKTGDTAPDFGGLIGYNRKSGEIMGCDVVDGTAEFTIQKRMASLTLGWLRHFMDCCGTVNETRLFNLEPEEALLVGGDGSYKDGDPKPWTVSAKWRYGQNREDVVVGALTFPTVMAHDYVWIAYETVEETVTHNGVAMPVLIEYPLWGYCEKVYPSSEHNSLGFN